MYLYLVRHGNASDFVYKNPLSEKGIIEIKGIISIINNKNIKVKAIYHSNKLRTKQTANLLSKAIESELGVIQKDGLLPLDDIDSIRNFISAANDNIMLVGHLPYMNELASSLTELPKQDENIQFDTGTLLCLKKNNSVWQVQWALRPEQ
jgi:phosphohistidine phosphatase